MKFISDRNLRGKSAQIWRQLRDEREMVIISNGKPVAILLSVCEDDLEESLKAIRQARALTALEAMQRSSVQAGTDRMTLSEINEEIKSVRRKRAK
ncbi:MAG: type II toxin-antitoxin system Phd/YefM family antitoxin [Sedimentisphaerales bacterium]|nr:type II toxin-antitoxin system Phd/YefM family antitoxin [Sedimentisphaerales bacterium]